MGRRPWTGFSPRLRGEVEPHGRMPAGWRDTAPKGRASPLSGKADRADVELPSAVRSSPFFVVTARGRAAWSAHTDHPGYRPSLVITPLVGVIQGCEAKRRAGCLWPERSSRPVNAALDCPHAQAMTKNGKGTLGRVQPEAPGGDESACRHTGPGTLARHCAPGEPARYRVERIMRMSRSRIFLRRVLRLTPRSSAALIWLPRVAARAALSSGYSISRRMR